MDVEDVAPALCLLCTKNVGDREVLQLGHSGALECPGTFLSLPGHGAIVK